LSSLNLIISIAMERGCPQGSVLGPTAWNWCMDLLLQYLCEDTNEDEVNIIAYVDDIAMLLIADYRNGFKKIVRQISEIVSKRCSFHKLKIAVDKTNAMNVKGKFSKNRNPTIKIDGVNVKFASQVKYLSVIPDEKMSFVEHAKHIRNKLLNFIMAIKRIANQEWDIKHYSKKILYNMVAIPITTYSAAVWFDCTNHTHLQRHAPFFCFSREQLEQRLLLPCRLSRE